MKKYIKILLPLGIIAITIFVIYTIFNNPPKAKKSDNQKSSKIKIETIKLKKENYHVLLESYGLSEASIETTLSSQVSGKIVYVSPFFKDGASFKKGDLLIQIEDVDYISDVQIAKAELILAKQALLEEEAMSKQAKEDWKKFNIKEKPNSLVLRIPQMESAKANLLAAKATLEKAEQNLKRTKIYAPYDGIVKEKNIAIAQVIASNSAIGTIFSNEYIEVKLPLKNKELKLIDINQSIKDKALVEFYSELSDSFLKGFIVRAQSTIDENTKQLYLIAQIKNHNIKIGEYLKAKISAKYLENIIIIPNSSIYQNSYVYIHKDNVITRREVEILWQNDSDAIIKSGIEDEEELVITTLGQVSSGTKVQVINNMDKKQ